MMNYPSLHIANTTLHVISIISNVVMLILLLCIRCMNSNICFWREYSVVFYMLMFIVWSYFMDNVIFLVHDFISFPCNISSFFQLWLSNQTTLLFSAFVLSLNGRRLKLAFLYWSIPCFGSIVLALVSSLTFYSTKSDSQCFWYDNVYQEGHLILYLIPQFLCILFNIGVVIYILVMKTFSLPTSYLVYPFVPLVTQFGTIVNQIMLHTSKTQDEGLEWWACISNGLGGLIVLMVFLLSPVFWQGMGISKCTSLWSTTANHNPNGDDTSSDNKILKAMTKTDSMASSMTTRTSTLSTHENNGPINTTMKEKQDDTETNTSIPKKDHRSFYQPCLSPHRRDSPIIIFPPPPTISPTGHVDTQQQQQQQQQQNPTSIELDESDFIGMFSKPNSLRVDTALSATYDSTSTGLQSPPSPALLLPVCYEMEDAVPWRVLEADEEDEEDDQHCNNNLDDHRHDDSTNIPTCFQQSQNGIIPLKSANNKPPRYSSLSASTSGYRKESWLSLDDDAMEGGGLYDEEKYMDPHHSLTSSSAPSSVSEWLTRRGDSFDGVREQMGRTSKSIRRWCKNVNRQQQDDMNMDPLDDGQRPTLHVVHEEPQ